MYMNFLEMHRSLVLKYLQQGDAGKNRYLRNFKFDICI